MKTPFFAGLLMVCLVSCENFERAPSGAVAAKHAAAPAKAARKAPKVIAIVADTGFKEQLLKQGPALTARAAAPSNGVSFAGTARKAAKISIAPGTAQARDLSELITWCRAHDSEMRHHQPAISTAASSARLPEENQNVTVDAWIHFAKKEADNDYHLIIGTSENADDSALMNVEISGLPPQQSKSFARLQNARNSFEGMFAGSLSQLQQSGYAKLTPVHVHITGSLFYDIDHAAGVVGPTHYRAKSAWEVHPISSITAANP